MARPQMDSRVEGQSPAAPQSCRMEVLRRDARSIPSGSQPCHRRLTVTQTSPVHVQEVSSPSSHPQQDRPLTDNTGPANETQQPLPDLLLASHSFLSESSQRDSPDEEEPTPEEQAIHRVAIQLRTIGDELNAVYNQRRNEAPQWQNWRGLYRGLVAFLADTMSTLYQHGFR
ncbi:bcl-2-binding component 3 [Hoplias malabaricus]|uniref:bcl-2-binding component 3 n=1 Tax=Hoplias malabaricus TaxID=27720 RepID=UPI003462525F